MNFQIKRLLQRYPALEAIENELHAAYCMLETCCAAGKTIYLCGNGGSASDCEHIVGELMKPFQISRPLNDAERLKLAEQGAIGQELARYLQHGLRAISLSSANALTSAISNDMGGRFVFAQQIFNYGRPGDVLICISTSGNSENILYGAAAARSVGVRVISLSGRDGGHLKALSDVCVLCPADTAEAVQEYHLPIYHMLCAALEAHFWGGRFTDQESAAVSIFETGS